MYVLLSGFRLRYAATPQPKMGDLTPGPINPLLLFAIETLLWLLISIIQVSSPPNALHPPYLTTPKNPSPVHNNNPHPPTHPPAPAHNLHRPPLSF